MPLNITLLPEDETYEILMKYFTTPTRKGYVQVEGCTMPNHFPSKAQGILDFIVREEDVFVCSYPKCGTTWTQEMVWCIANDLDLETAKSTLLLERFPFLEMNGEFNIEEMLKLNPENDIPYLVRDPPGFLSSLEGPRFIKSHLPLRLLPKQMQDERRPAKMIYVNRDPRDCCISYYHHVKLVNGYTGDFQNFLKLFMAGRVSFGHFWDSVLEFWKIRHDPNVLFITFEDMKKDLPSVIRTVSKFLDKSYSEEQVKMLSEHLSFESMRVNPCVNYEEGTRKMGSEKGDFMRSGQSGQFLKAMSSSDIEMLNKWCQEHIGDTGYELPKYNV